jgi:hypothetical protein
LNGRVLSQTAVILNQATIKLIDYEYRSPSYASGDFTTAQQELAAKDAFEFGYSLAPSSVPSSAPSLAPSSAPTP